jgi:cytochrome c biogenesis protein
MVEYGLLARGEDHRLAGEAAAIRKLLSSEWRLDATESAPSSSQSAPSGAGNNGRADTDAARDQQASPEDHEAGFIQSTAGSPESKKDQ